jgi:hypothetical protein
MMSFGAIRRVVSFIGGVAFLTGCSLAQPSLEPSTAAQQGAGASAHQMTPTELLYAGIKHYVDVYSFPNAGRVRSFRSSGEIQAMCSDTKGDVFVAAAAPRASTAAGGFVYEYAPAKKGAVATLDLPKAQVPMACSSDPTTGNLAVTAQNKRDYAPGIAIYDDASGTPKFYRLDALGENPQAAYDDKGNLFATSGGDVGVELPAGKSAFIKITLAQTLGGVDHVQWDGTYWALQSFEHTRHNGENLFERIFRVKISGSNGKVVQVVSFDRWPEKNSGQSWIQNGTIAATPLSSIVLWAYPAGGKPTKIVHSNLGVKAITVSTGG